MRRVFLFILSLCFTHSMFSHPGVGMVMDSRGNVYYTDLVHVWKISSAGEVTIAVENVHTHQLHLDEQDNLYGEHVWYEGEQTDTWSYYIWCLDNAGNLEQTVPPTRGFPENNTLVRDRAGNSFYSEKSGQYDLLKKRNLSGTVQNFTDHQFRDIRWLFFNSHTNSVLVIDHLNLKRVDSFGNVQLISDQLHDEGSSYEGVQDRHYLMGAWGDTEGNLYTAVFGARKVKKVNPRGIVSTLYKSPIGWSPCSGLIDPDGNLWVMEFSVLNRTRVKKINPNGKDEIYKG